MRHPSKSIEGSVAKDCREPVQEVSKRNGKSSKDHSCVILKKTMASFIVQKSCLVLNWVNDTGRNFKIA